MRKPREPRKPRPARNKRAPRAKFAGITSYSVTCKSCGAKFKYTSHSEPKFCIICKSESLDVKSPSINSANLAEAIGEFSRLAFGQASWGGLFSNFLWQYSARLEPPPPPVRHMTLMRRAEAARFIAQHASGFAAIDIEQSADVRDRAYRDAARKLHPDTGGSHDLFIKLQRAKEALNVQ